MKTRVFIPLAPNAPVELYSPIAIECADLAMEGLNDLECLESAQKLEDASRLIRQRITGDPFSKSAN